MKIKKRKFTIAKNNEDEIFEKDNLFMVIDGATPKGDKIFKDLESDTYWLHPFIEKHLDKAKNPKIFFEKLEKDLVDSFPEKDADSLNVPSAGVIYAYINEKDILITGLGDCVALVETKNGVIRVLDSPLVDLDNQVLSKVSKIRAENDEKSLWDVMDKVDKDIKDNRSKLNSKGGYGVIAPKTGGLEYINVKKFNKEEVISISLMSDGVYQFVDTLKMGTDKDLVKMMKNNDLSIITDMILEKQLEDKDGKMYPRFKLSDDMCVIHINFQN